MFKHSLLALVGVLAATGCGGAATASAPVAPVVVATAVPSPSPSPSPPESLLANGFAAKLLAEGRLAQLPAAPYYINYLDLPQEPAASLTHAHIGGFVYGAAGVTTINVGDGAAINLNAGEAAFVGSGVAHTHLNAGTGPNDWYYVSLRPSSTRTAAPIVAGQKVLFETPDLAELPAMPYTERLMLVTIEEGGRGAPHVHGGSETLLVLSGTVRLRVSGRDVVLKAGDGFTHEAGTAIQDINAGSGQARMLAFFVTPEGATFRTDTGTAP